MGGGFGRGVREGMAVRMQPGGCIEPIQRLTTESPGGEVWLRGQGSTAWLGWWGGGGVARGDDGTQQLGCRVPYQAWLIIPSKGHLPLAQAQLQPAACPRERGNGIQLHLLHS